MTAQPTTRPTSPPAALRQPTYSFADVDRLAGAAAGTARYWLRRYAGLTGSDASFVDLVGVALVSRLKHAGLPPAAVARLFGEARHRLGIARPVEHHSFRDLVAHGRAQSNEDSAQQAAAEFLADIDYADGWLDQWWPVGRNEPIVVHPAYGWGFPTIARNGVRTEILHDAVRSGLTVETVAAEYNASPDEVTRAVAFESRLAR